MVHYDFCKALWRIASKEAGPGTEPVCPTRPDVCKDLCAVIRAGIPGPPCLAAVPVHYRAPSFVVWTTWVYKTTGLFKHFNPMKLWFKPKKLFINLSYWQKFLEECFFVCFLKVVT